MKEPVIMLDLEEKLLADKDGRLRAKLMADLRGTQGRLQGELRKMHSQSTHRELQGAMQAVTAALQVLQTLRIPVGDVAQLKSKNGK